MADFRLALVAVCVLVGTAEVNGQYRFDQWTTDTGLPQNTINAITQTRDGYLWFATLDGLVRYDGVRFHIFDRSNTPALTSNRFTCLYEDREGVLWAGTDADGLMRYQNGAFTRLTIADGPRREVRQVQGHPDGGLMLVMNWDALVLFKDGKPSPQTAFAPFREGTARIVVGPSGTIWLWHRSGLHQFTGGRRHTYPIPYSSLFSALYEDQTGTLWGAHTPTGSTRVHIFRITDGIVTDVADDGIEKVEFISAIVGDRRGNLWLGTAGHGLIRFRDGRFTTYTMADGLSSNAITSIYEDREGTIWVGTEDNGLNRLTPRFIRTYTTRDGLPNDVIYPIYQDRAGAIWIGTNGGLSRYANGVFTNFDLSTDVTLNRVQSLGEDRDGRLWVGDYNVIGWLEGRRRVIPPQAAGQPANPQHVVYLDRRGRLWLGTYLYLAKIENGVWTYYRKQEGLPGQDVNAIVEDRDGHLWIGTYGGLARLDGDRFTAWTTRDGLASDRVRSLYLDAEGVLWVGTYDGGLSRFKNGRFTTYTTKDGLFSNGVFQILEDSRGNYWMSSNRGIFRVSRRQLNDFADGKATSIICTAYGKPDGLLNTESNGGRQPAGIKARDGRLWFPTMGGIAVIDADAAPIVTEPPPVLVETVSVDRAEVALDREVRVEPGQGNLEIAYTGLSFLKPEQVRFRYRLIGQDDRWVEAGTRRTAYYPYLPPGRYTFQVIAANSDGVWNASGAHVRIVVLPPFWRTWWFAVSVGAALLAAAFVGYRMRIRQLIRAHATQRAFARRLIESQENERRRIAGELHDSLGQSLAIISNRARLSLNAPDDHDRMVEQMTEISGAVRETMAEMREIAHDLRPYQLDRLGLTKALESMIQKIALTSEIAFSAEIDMVDGVFSKESEINVYRIVQESVNNVVRHSGATQARIAVRRDARGVQMTIEDNGHGFAHDAMRKAGLGLTGISERARMLGGRHEIHSAPGKGTRITIKIGLHDHHGT